MNQLDMPDRLVIVGDEWLRYRWFGYQYVCVGPWFGRRGVDESSQYARREGI